VAATTLAASLLLTACWAFTPSPRQLVMATSLVPFALIGYAVAGVAWWAVRRLSVGSVRRVSTGVLVVSLLGVLLHAGLLVPSYAGSHASGRPDLTVLTSNLRLGRGDTDEVTRFAERGDADVVVLQEVTPQALDDLADLRRELPHQAGMPFVGARGTVVLSRYPLEEISQLKIYQGAWVMHVVAPKPFWLVAVHTSQPVGWIDTWRADHRALLWNTTLALKKGPLVMAGDFNATLDHRPMRMLLDLGLSDAARQSNAGWQPTWPGDPDVERALPFGLGAVAIDHVLVSKQFSAISTSTERIDRTDHRALLARLAFR
jgi:endonuclease/exonuclease/phosphatase (EEP) superfamily protein YafD